MNQFKLILSFSLLLMSELIFACPGCAGSLNNPYDKNVIIILGIFILLTYVPFYLIWRLIIKNRNLNQITPK
jgi:hypothetical protein